MYEFRKASNDFKFQMEEELRNAEEADRRKKEEERLRGAGAGRAGATTAASVPGLPASGACRQRRTRSTAAGRDRRVRIRERSLTLRRLVHRRSPPEETVSTHSAALDRRAGAGGDGRCSLRRRSWREADAAELPEPEPPSSSAEICRCRRENAASRGPQTQPTEPGGPPWLIPRKRSARRGRR